MGAERRAARRVNVGFQKLPLRSKQFVITRPCSATGSRRPVVTVSLAQPTPLMTKVLMVLSNRRTL